MPAKLADRLTAKMEDRLTAKIVEHAKLVNHTTAKLVERLTAKQVDGKPQSFRLTKTPPPGCCRTFKPWSCSRSELEYISHTFLDNEHPIFTYTSHLPHFFTVLSQ